MSQDLKVTTIPARYLGSLLEDTNFQQRIFNHVLASHYRNLQTAKQLTDACTRATATGMIAASSFEYPLGYDQPFVISPNVKVYIEAARAVTGDFVHNAPSGLCALLAVCHHEAGIIVRPAPYLNTKGDREEADELEEGPEYTMIYYVVVTWNAQTKRWDVVGPAAAEGQLPALIRPPTSPQFAISPALEEAYLVLTC